MDISEAINHIISRSDLSNSQMRSIMQCIMTGKATNAQIGGFLVSLRMKGETVTEITAAARVMRDLASGVDIGDLSNAVDIVGTGGDSSGTFNISTACMFVAAAAGCPVAKHGNRSVSSKSGSADALEAAGVNLNITPNQVAQCVHDIGVGFMFAPGHHSAMKHAISARREMGVRTLFNVLGPLTNPANVDKLLLGVFDRSLIQPMAEVLRELDVQHALVVNSKDGLDEISIGDTTNMAELKNGNIKTFDVNPEDFGFTTQPLDNIRVEDPQQSIALIRDVLSGNKSTASDIVAFNSGAAIYVSGLCENLISGIKKAKDILQSGKGLEKLNDLVELSQSFKERT